MSPLRCLQLIVCFLLSIVMSSCDDPKPAPPLDSPSESVGYTDRAAEVAARVGPPLRAEIEAAGLSWADEIFIRIFKESSELELWMQGSPAEAYQLFKTYEIARYSGDLGPKLREGDRQAPEGFYQVRSEQMNPASRFHLAFNLGFPNAYDLCHGRTGTYLMVHGDEVSTGCYAMTDTRIEEIYTVVDAALNAGQNVVQVHCFPFHLTEARLSTVPETHPWKAFWTNLSEGYLFFERHRRVPEVDVREQRYVFY